MTESQLDQTGERNLNTSSGSADHSRTATQTLPPVEQKGAEPQGTAALLETKDNSIAAGLEQTVPEDRPTVAEDTDTGGQLFTAGAKSTFRTRWDSIQTRFVDQPTQAVKEADTLVTEVVDGLTRTFASEREALEKQWTNNKEASTEDLRQAFQKYRSFFDRLLAA